MDAAKALTGATLPEASAKVATWPLKAIVGVAANAEALVVTVYW
jgi:hypothetical protein